MYSIYIEKTHRYTVRSPSGYIKKWPPKFVTLGGYFLLTFFCFCDKITIEKERHTDRRYVQNILSFFTKRSNYFGGRLLLFVYQLYQQHNNNGNDCKYNHKHFVIAHRASPPFLKIGGQRSCPPFGGHAAYRYGMPFPEQSSCNYYTKIGI